ncbi:MAG: methionine--tRNA ligase [Verrucomicrobiales bacterium]|nr:methionine--tRNA ligase [Verrucomicrobiales bacterium]
MTKPFYITTAIDYTNAPPHIGHAYEKVLADAIARYYRLLGREVYFLTGVDQHGQKVQQSAEKAGVSPQEFVAGITETFRDLWHRLEVCHDGWAATTEEVHKRVVQSMLQQLFDAGQIYKRATKGWYSVRQEQFLGDKDRGPDGAFGSEWGQVEEREEENYYFRLSDHVDWLLAFLDAHPDTVFPDSRLQQLRNAVEDSRGIDLCISRPKNRLHWGIELPFDPDFVTYVWFDALTNYISFAGFRKETGAALPDFETLWPCDAHIIGKDILVPAHGIYWLIMLHAIGLTDDQMPKILVHGWWNVRGEKMSKTLGNVINPHDIADAVGVDGLRYYLLSDIATGGDSDMSELRVITRYNKDLADVLGNLLNRTLNMAHRYLGGVLLESAFDDGHCAALRAAVEALPGKVAAELPGYQIHRALAAIWEVLAAANGFIQTTKPFQLAKDPANAPQVAAVIRHLAETLAHCSVLISPVIPNAARGIQAQLGWSPAVGMTLADLRWGLLPAGHRLGEGRPLFPKIEPSKEA